MVGFGLRMPKLIDRSSRVALSEPSRQGPAAVWLSHAAASCRLPADIFIANPETQAPAARPRMDYYE